MPNVSNASNVSGGDDTPTRLLRLGNERRRLLRQRKSTVCSTLHPADYNDRDEATVKRFVYVPEFCYPRDVSRAAIPSSPRRQRNNGSNNSRNDRARRVRGSPPLPEWWEREVRQLEDIESSVFGPDSGIDFGAASSTMFHLPRVLTAPPAPLDQMTAYMLVNGFAVDALPRVTKAPSIRRIPNARRRLQNAMRDFSGGALLTYPQEVQDDALAVAAKAAKAAHMIRRAE